MVFLKENWHFIIILLGHCFPIPEKWLWYSEANCSFRISYTPAGSELSCVSTFKSENIFQSNNFQPFLSCSTLFCLCPFSQETVAYAFLAQKFWICLDPACCLRALIIALSVTDCSTWGCTAFSRNLVTAGIHNFLTYIFCTFFTWFLPGGKSNETSLTFLYFRNICIASLSFVPPGSTDFKMLLLDIRSLNTRIVNCESEQVARRLSLVDQPSLQTVFWIQLNHPFQPGYS